MYNEHLQTVLSFLDLVLTWLRNNSLLIIEFALCLCIGLLIVLLRRVAELRRLMRDVGWVTKP